jgi:hypothetical protein
MAKVMGIVGTRESGLSPAMIEQTIFQTEKALNAGWRVATGGASGVDSVVMQTALDMGKGNMLDIYLPKDMAYQPYSAQNLIKQAESQGATVKFDQGYTSGLFGEKSSFDIKNRNTVIVENSNAIVAIQNNNSRGTADTIAKANEAGIPVKKISFLSGILRSSTLLNCFGAFAGALSAMLGYQDLQVYINYLNKLLEKYKSGETLTPEEEKQLMDAGALDMADAGINEGNYESIVISGSGHKGNPYHDRQGRFCSAADAATVSA